jgi:hypothetical protein
MISVASFECQFLSVPGRACFLLAHERPLMAHSVPFCDFVHRHIAFGYEHARTTMTSWEVFNEGKGVCRDYAHLAISFCRLHEYSGALLHRLSPSK